MTAAPPLPRWADLLLLPLVCLGVALLAAAGVVALVGQNPVEVVSVLVQITTMQESVAPRVSPPPMMPIRSMP